MPFERSRSPKSSPMRRCRSARTMGSPTSWRALRCQPQAAVGQRACSRLLVSTANNRSDAAYGLPLGTRALDVAVTARTEGRRGRGAGREASPRRVPRGGAACAAHGRQVRALAAMTPPNEPVANGGLTYPSERRIESLVEGPARHRGRDRPLAASSGVSQTAACTASSSVGPATDATGPRRATRGARPAASTPVRALSFSPEHTYLTDRMPRGPKRASSLAASFLPR